MQPARLKARRGGTAVPGAASMSDRPSTVSGASSAATARPASKPARARRWPVLPLTVLAVVLAWAVTATVLLLRERAAVATLKEEQAFQQRLAEDRIRTLTRRLVSAVATGGSGAEKDGLGSQLAEIITRQVDLETRQQLLRVLTGQTLAPLVPQRGAARAPLLNALSVADRDPLPSDVLLDAFDAAMPVPTRKQVQEAVGAAEPLDLKDRVVSLERSLARVEAGQMQLLPHLATTMAGRVQEMRTVLAELGVDLARLKLPAARVPAGPPLLPPGSTPAPGSFEHALQQFGATRDGYARWRDLATIVPFRRPLDGDDNTTSNFGMRTDPFTGVATMHAGMDFRAETGTPVRAGGAGRVLRAEVAGGYGNLVELDHGNGLTTRYGHLSAIDVQPGQIVDADAVIGRVGSTGRSTGPHLHYETRRDDEALNPLRFMQAGQQLGEAQAPGRQNGPAGRGL